MLSPSKLAQSADLMTGILDRIGKTLVAPGAHASRANAQAARNMVYRCAACPDQDGCRRLQATALHLERPPLFCTNAERLMALPDV
ncbi:DUF6455 family protein [Tateyamaria sp. SN3-11]|uniref:DUF6455 family protein n=1 Tax=Tateyamaria sp. SN3-11 TaxID=3092147 RepID=UPI0039EAA1B8